MGRLTLEPSRARRTFRGGGNEFQGPFALGQSALSREGWERTGSIKTVGALPS